MTRYKLGINMIFAGNRFSEPEVWARLIREELDLDYVEFSTDLVDPLWPRSVVEDYVARTKQALKDYRLSVYSVFSGSFSRRHVLMHPDPQTRRMWYRWYKAFIRLGADLGAPGVGSPFGAMTVRDANDPQRRQDRILEAIRLWRKLTFFAWKCGLEYLYFETMSTYREIPDTIETTLDLFHNVNADAGLPTYLCLDVGHAPHPSQRDPYRWLRELGAYAKVVHLQQTDVNNSRHWPFTAEYNAIGIIHPLQVLESIEASGAREIFLGFEIFHRECYEQELRVINDLKESVIYWRQFLKDELRSK